jgi:hypothetical protein
MGNCRMKHPQVSLIKLRRKLARNPDSNFVHYVLEHAVSSVVLQSVVYEVMLIYPSGLCMYQRSVSLSKDDFVMGVRWPPLLAKMKIRTTVLR